MACPEHAIVQEQGKIRIKKDVCSGCGKCAQVCPMGVYELIGRYVSVEELVEELIKDMVFYEVSGGGVTFSGGEPVLQHKFLKQLAVELKKQKIHMALDTSGSVSWNCLEEILNFIDLVLYDIKAMDEKTHKKCTGATNRLILENAVKISELKIPMIVRFVIVPGYNDTEKDVKARLEFVKNLRSVQQIDILPYHRLGVAKYERLGIDYALNHVKPPSEEHINRLKSFIELYGYKAAIGG
jgi:pyruvate formate lyase activating enzyme